MHASIRLLAAVVASLVPSLASAADILYVARLAPDGTTREERSLSCDASLGCMLAFDEAADDWRQTLSLQVVAKDAWLVVTARSAGTGSEPLLVAVGSVALGAGGGVATLRLTPPRYSGGKAAPISRTGPEAGFGPFLIALHQTPD